MLEELLDVIEEGTIAAQLGRGSSLSIHDERPAGGSDGASRTERLAPSIVSAPADDLMAGLAEALKDVQPTRSAPASGLYVEHRWAHVDVRGPDVAESGTTQLDLAEYLNEGGQTAGHRELWRLLKALFKEQSGAPRS